jgi:hypothetical protein
VNGTQVIRQTTTPALYQSSRTGGPFTYTLSVPNGLYTAVLKFAEPAQTAPGQRSFDVTINGKPALTTFDIFAEAGGQNVAVDRSFPVAVSTGGVTMSFVPGVSVPLVSAIELRSGTTTASSSMPGTVRVNVGGSALTDVSGLAWGADSGSRGGTPVSTTAAIPNSAIPELYQTASTGALSYRLGMPNGTYSVVLKFAEIQYSAAGARQFNVAINGTRVLTNFDIFAAAKSAASAVDRAFPATVTDGLLTIDLSAGAAGIPLLNGIEIVPVLN